MNHFTTLLIRNLLNNEHNLPEYAASMTRYTSEGDSTHCTGNSHRWIERNGRSNNFRLSHVKNSEIPATYAKKHQQ